MSIDVFEAFATETSESDFDDDDDPDKTEVPGGGKDLQTAITYGQGVNNKVNSILIPNSNTMQSTNSSPKIKPPQMDIKILSSNDQLLTQSKVSFSNMIPTPMPDGKSLNNNVLQNLQALLAANPNFLAGGIPNNLFTQAWIKSEKEAASRMGQSEEEYDAEDEEMGVAETYAEYWPSKLKLGKKHPDPVVETASLSSVAPTDVYYKLFIPMETINNGLLSALQLESITYASQAHNHLLPCGSRAGFLIGDGAGVGKGRTIAGIIYENYLRGRKKALWISVSNDLKYDAERDFLDIGAYKIPVYALNKFKYAKISSDENNKVKKGVIFSTYSALISESNSKTGKYKSRLKQLLQWCGEEFDGCIIFDECHKAKNLCPVGSNKPTKTGATVLELQNKLPNGRVIYASATGASEPRNMAYMVRLGMWGVGTPFSTFNKFLAAIEKRGVGAMEIVAMDMKLRGMYIARQLSFHGVIFKIEEVPLSEKFKKVYDDSVAVWVEAMHKFTEAAKLVDAESRMKKTLWGQFWSAHQRFFKYLCIASKVNHAIKLAADAIKLGKCVVIGLQSTGETRTLEQLDRDDGELSDFVSTAKGVFQSLIEKNFPAPNRDRIRHILGISPKLEKLEEIVDEGTSGSKRKSGQQAAAQQPKRTRLNNSPGRSPDKSNQEDSDFTISASEHEESDVNSGSCASSDFNPFYSCSDSDADPWVSTRKKKKITMQKLENPKHAHIKNEEIPMTQGNGILYQFNPAPKDAIKKAYNMKEELLNKIDKLGSRLPPNTLDQLIDELGGTENVAEMTGRKGRVVQTENGSIQYESRSENDVSLETLNLIEKQRFMNGEKNIAIISEAASSGISLQSDRRVRNQKRRVHITLELPWSADRAIQQFGRTHRSNQVNAPEYIFLISDLAGERRFASTVAKRLESLGALTHGDRRATEARDLSQFNVDNKYGKTALESVMKTIMGYEPPIVPPPSDYQGDFFKDIAAALVGVGLIINCESTPGILVLDKDYNNILKFLNRILGMPVELQNRLFKYFTDTLAAIISQAKKMGRFDLGILDLGAVGENVSRVKLLRFIRKHATGIAPVELHTVQVERGFSWADAMDKYNGLIGDNGGFYLSYQIRNGKKTAMLAVEIEPQQPRKSNEKYSKKDIRLSIYRPNSGLQIRNESLTELEKKYKKISYEIAETLWKQQYEASLKTCLHSYWNGNCKNAIIGLECEVGLRRRTYTVLGGSVLSVWSRVEDIFGMHSVGPRHKMQVIRLKTTEGIKIVGTLIPKTCVEPLIMNLSLDSEKVEEHKFSLN